MFSVAVLGWPAALAALGHFVIVPALVEPRCARVLVPAQLLLVPGLISPSRRS